MKAAHPLKIAGTSVVRLDGAEKVTGKAIYTVDVELPGMVHGKILRSPLPHARVAAIDARKAEKLPGVLTVLTRGDIASLNYMFGAIYKDQSIVAVDRVRFAGDPVAAVAAQDEETAEEAVKLIDVEYEELPAVANLEEALAPGAPLVHEAKLARTEMRGSSYGAPERFQGTNVCFYFGLNIGNVEDGFKKADYVFEDTFRFPKVQH
ncbi:MAG: xanthine dehydrogenase family protein molybdopterin-binding subunit, partial [Candidatus Binatia bacterium]